VSSSEDNPQNSTAGAWLDFVNYDNLTGDLTILMNEGIGTANETELKLYVHAWTLGKVFKTKLLTFLFVYPYVNKAPEFVTEPIDLFLEITEEE
jgi:hypothetical protein